MRVPKTLTMTRKNKQTKKLRPKTRGKSERNKRKQQEERKIDGKCILN